MNHAHPGALRLTVLAISLLLAGCAVGPDYKRPETPVTAASTYKEIDGWKPAQPRDDTQRGNWWAVYQDAQLDALMQQIDINNLNVAQYEARYRQSQALTTAARAAYFPTLSADVSSSRSRASQAGERTSTDPAGGGTGTTTGSGGSSVSTQHSASLSAAWEADLWGKLRRGVESQQASTQASAADLVNARLSAQATLATDYFTLRTLDAQQKLNDETVAAYERSLNLTQNQYKAGIVAKADVVQAQTQLKGAQAQAVDTGVQRAQTEHAIAVLLGKAPSDFSLPKSPLPMDRQVAVPVVPPGLPSQLLERRPDIAAQERRMAAANAQIGVQTAALYPDLTLSGQLGYSAASLDKWFTAPARFWSLGPQLAMTLFDNGARRAQIDQARASYDENVALYRQTVLAGLQEVEDNLAALRILENEAQLQDETVVLAKQSLDLALNRYKSGTASYVEVITAQATLFNAQKSAVQILQRRLTASVTLVKAAGGGWDAGQLPYGKQLDDAGAKQASAK